MKADVNNVVLITSAWIKTQTKTKQLSSPFTASSSSQPGGLKTLQATLDYSGQDG